jgi:hypothetical protein
MSSNIKPLQHNVKITQKKEKSNIASLIKIDKQGFA